MISILTDPDQQSDEKRMQRREKAMTTASEHFDFHEMSKRVLGTTWRKLNHDEQEHFVTLFL
jgi:phospholipid transport system substrate-binding protein